MLKGRYPPPQYKIYGKEIREGYDAPCFFTEILDRGSRAETECIKVTKQLQKIKFLPDKKSMVTEDAQLAEQYAQYNYLSKIQNRLMKACNENARELGLTISSRCKLVIPKEKDDKPENKFMKHTKRA